MRKIIGLILIIALIPTMTMGCGKKEKQDNSLENEPKIESVSDILVEVEAANKGIQSVDFQLSVDTEGLISSTDQEATSVSFDGDLYVEFCMKPFGLKFDYQVSTEGLRSPIKDNSNLEGYITVVGNNLVSYLKSSESKQWVRQIIGPIDSYVSYNKLETNEQGWKDFLISSLKYKELNYNKSSYYQLEGSYDLQSLIDATFSNVDFGEDSSKYQEYFNQFLDTYHLDLGKLVAEVKILIDKKDFAPLVCVVDFSKSDLSELGKVLFGEFCTFHFPTCTSTIRINGINTINRIEIPNEVIENAESASK